MCPAPRNWKSRPARDTGQTGRAFIRERYKVELADARPADAETAVSLLGFCMCCAQVTNILNGQFGPSRVVVQRVLEFTKVA
jgi:hypothetical protein